MKKNIYLAAIALLFLSVACSKSDNGENSDPVFDAVYTPIKSIKDIDSNAWAYKGAKIGNRKFGRISDKSCMTKNVLTFKQVNSEHPNGILDYYNYNYSAQEKGCGIEFVSRLMIHYVANNEAWCTYKKLQFVPDEGDGKEDEDPIEADPTDEEMERMTAEAKRLASSNTDLKSYNEAGDHKPSKVEIGFQAGYLRIEDKVSDFNGKEKVYLYFVKQ